MQTSKAEASWAPSKAAAFPNLTSGDRSQTKCRCTKIPQNLPLLNLSAYQIQVCFMLKSHSCIYVNIPKSKTVQNKRLPVSSVWGWRYSICTYKLPLPTTGNVYATEKTIVGHFHIQFCSSLMSEKCQIKREWTKYSSVPSLLTLKHVIIYEAHTCRKTVQERSPVWRILSACEKNPRKQGKGLVTSVSSKARNCSWNVLPCPPRCSR